MKKVLLIPILLIASVMFAGCINSTQISPEVTTHDQITIPETPPTAIPPLIEQTVVAIPAPIPIQPTKEQPITIPTLTTVPEQTVKQMGDFEPINNAAAPIGDHALIITSSITT